MRTQKKTHDLTRLNEVNVKKPQKHDANLQKNTTLYFQVGLIVCLLFTYGLLEMKFETNIHDIGYVIIDDPDDRVINVNPIIERPEVKQVAKKSIPARLIEKFKLAPDDLKIQATENVVIEPPSQVDPIAINAVVNVKPPEEPVIISFDFVEAVPVYPGCEKSGSNEERKACMAEQIAKHIQRNFDTNVADGLGLTGKQRINVGFKINQNGDIVEVIAITKYKALKLEAETVIGKLPKMTPGKQHDKNVSVVYSQPIVFYVED